MIIMERVGLSAHSAKASPNKNSHKKGTIMTNISRRTLLAAAGLAAAGIPLASAEAQQQGNRQGGGQGNRQGGGNAGAGRRTLEFKNEDFYTDGKFDEEKAKDGILRLCRYHGYPIYPGLREALWVSDYGTGKFTTLGLAATCMANKTEPAGETYMLQELFLLPGQMLPEHWHEKGEFGIKDEGWFIRWGRSYVIGEGEPNLPPEVKVPDAHGEVTVQHCTIADPGVFVPLSKVGTHHWQFAGKEGVILTEVANYHDGASVRFINEIATKAFGN